MEKPRRIKRKELHAKKISYKKIIFLLVVFFSIISVAYSFLGSNEEVFTTTTNEKQDLVVEQSVEDKEQLSLKSEPIVKENNLNVSKQGLNILIDKSDYKLYLLDGGTILKEYDVAVGKNYGDKEKPGDMRTPIGHFIVDEIIDSSFWTHDFKDGKGEIEGAYGPWFFSLETPWDGIGVHGTHDPNSIRTNVSEGCVRMHNSDLIELKEKVFVGLPVEIRE